MGLVRVSCLQVVRGAGMVPAVCRYHCISYCISFYQHQRYHHSPSTDITPAWELHFQFSKHWQWREGLFTDATSRRHRLVVRWEGRSVGTICLQSAAPPAMSPSLWISVSPPSARRLNSEQQIESSTNCYHPNDSSLTVFTGYLGSSHISFCFICFGKTLFIYLKYIFWIDFLLNLHRWIDLRSGQWHWKLLSRSTWN